MKSLIAFILAVVMSLSTTACAVQEPSHTESSQTASLTLSTESLSSSETSGDRDSSSDIRLEQISDNGEFRLALSGVSSGLLFVAAFGADNRMIAVTGVSHEASNTEETLAFPQAPPNGSKLKVFLLDDKKAPLMKAAELIWQAPVEKKILVAYFSCTNTTKAAAEKIAQATGGELFAIVPETAYTSADLNYNTDCRANREQNDDNARPAISADCKVPDWRQYDVVFLGHPIWWGIPPKIMRTFCEQYDWTGKKIVGFCTSGGSGYSNRGLPELTKGAEWLNTKRLNGASQTDVVLRKI